MSVKMHHMKCLFRLEDLAFSPHLLSLFDFNLSIKAVVIKSLPSVGGLAQ